MKSFKISMVTLLTALAAYSSYAQDAGTSSDPCAHRSAMFGRIVATCGDRNITYIGDERRTILGVSTITSRFELTYCDGGGRFPLQMSTNSEGWTMKGEGITVNNMWGHFSLVLSGAPGSEPTAVACTPYNDPNTNPSMMYRSAR